MRASMSFLSGVCKEVYFILSNYPFTKDICIGEFKDVSKGWKSFINGG